MSKYSNILAAVDLSPHSEITLQHATELAKNNQAQLNIVHVIEHSPTAYGGDFSIPIDANLEETIEHQASITIGKLAEKYGITPDRQHLESGSVKLAINKLAKKLHVDLIIVGSHNHRGLDVLLGSRANAILHLAKCDVWVVKNK
ncbi:MAG: universal stress protein [Gammaproteobacteria bacterium]|nr:universal stress protein [Gammaproteobacteria bacterium]